MHSIEMPHRIITSPLRTYVPVPSGPVEIKMTPSGIVFITAGGKNIQVTGGASGTWPSPVTLDASDLDRLRDGREVRRIAVTWDGELHVEVAEYVPEPRYLRQPCLPFDLPLMPRQVVTLPVRAKGQMALEF